MDLLRGAERNVDLIAYAGLFLTEEHPEWIPTLAAKAASGARVRLLLGDPQGTQLAARDQEYRIGGGVAGRVAAVLRDRAKQLAPPRGVPVTHTPP
jgi:hypothetical protein